MFLKLFIQTPGFPLCRNISRLCCLRSRTSHLCCPCQVIAEGFFAFIDQDRNGKVSARQSILSQVVGTLEGSSWGVCVTGYRPLPASQMVAWLIGSVLTNVGQCYGPVGLHVGIWRLQDCCQRADWWCRGCKICRHLCTLAHLDSSCPWLPKPS